MARRQPKRVVEYVEDEAPPEPTPYTPPEAPVHREVHPTEETDRILREMMDAGDEQLVGEFLNLHDQEDEHAASAMHKDEPFPEGQHATPGVEMPPLPGIDGVKIKRGDRSIAIEKLIATIFAGLVVLGTSKLFGVDNAMVLEEAQSLTEPTTRIIGRRTQKYMNVALPLDKLSKEDKADVEEIVSVAGLYTFRLLVKAYVWLINQLKAAGAKQTAKRSSSTPPPGMPGMNGAPSAAGGVPFVPGVMSKDDIMAATGGDMGAM